MKYIRLGKTELSVSRVGFGGIPIIRVSSEEATRCIHTAIDLGVNFIDTAADYKDSEEKIGKAIKDRRDGLVIATKSPPTTAQRMEQAIDQSLRRLQIETIDLYQFHCVKNQATLQKSLDLMNVLEKAKKQGKIRHIGITVHGVNMIDTVLDTDAFETIMITLSFVVREAASSLPNARKRDVGVIAMKPMAGGQLEDPYLAFKYFMTIPDVSALVGIETSQQIEQIVKIMDEDIPPTAEELTEMETIAAKLGTRFCRRCEYCMPCEQGVRIMPLTVLKSMAKRIPLKDILTGNDSKTAVESFDNCNDCGKCEKKCPYNLEIRKVLKENQTYYNQLKKNHPTL